MTEGLRQFIDDDMIPREYGGTCAVPLGHMPMEQDFRRQVFANLRAAGVPLKTDPQMRNPDGGVATLDGYVYSPKRPGT